MSNSEGGNSSATHGEAPPRVALATHEEAPPSVAVTTHEKAPRAAMTQISEFGNVKQYPCFVDKTLMIKQVHDLTETMIITGPRRFGKSVNLSMLRRFYDIAEDNKTMFSNTKIGTQYPTFVEEHCNKYIVVWIDMSKGGSMISSVEKARKAMRSILHKTFLQYPFLSSSSKIGDKDDRKLCGDWCSFVRYVKLSDAQVDNGVMHLVTYLHRYYSEPERPEPRVVLLVDEFDYISTQADHRVNEAELSEIIRYIFERFSKLVKTPAPTESTTPVLHKAVFTGITAVTCNGPSPLNNVPQYKFLQDPHFVDCYGITLTEFDELLQKREFCNLRHQREDALQYYYGYQYKDKKLFCTYAVVSYLFEYSIAPRGQLRPFWSNSGALEGFHNVWSREEMQPLLQDIISGKMLVVQKIDKLIPRTLLKLRHIFSSEVNSPLPHLDVILAYLLQLGYLGVVQDTDNHSYIRVPNEDVRTEFIHIFIACLKTKYSFNIPSLLKCAKQLNQLINVSDGKIIHDIFAQFRELLEDACKENLVKEFLNETSVKHLLFAVLLFSKFSPISQVVVRNQNTITKLDLCFYTRDLGIIIELKFGERTNAKKALEQIEQKQYYNVFAEEPLKRIKRYIFVGIHLNHTGNKLSLEYENRGSLLPNN